MHRLYRFVPKEDPLFQNVRNELFLDKSDEVNLIEIQCLSLKENEDLSAARFFLPVLFRCQNNQSLC